MKIHVIKAYRKGKFVYSIAFSPDENGDSRFAITLSESDYHELIRKLDDPYEA